MNWLQPKLTLRVAQKQILTPGLVQMVSVLALNRLELREMINQEMMANPVLEEVGRRNVPRQDSYTDEAFLKKETEKVPETPAANPFDEFDFGSFFNQYLDTAPSARQAANARNRKALVRQISFVRAEPCRSSELAVERQRSAPKWCARSPNRSSATWMRTDT